MGFSGDNNLSASNIVEKEVKSKLTRFFEDNIYISRSLLTNGAAVDERGEFPQTVPERVADG